MKIIKTILDRPYIVILITAVILLFSSDSNISYVLGLICVIFTTSIIYTIIQKKWLRLLLSFFGYFVFLFFWLIFYMFLNEIQPQIEIGDSKFYSNEILKSTNLMIPNKLKIISKLDTIVFMGIEDEYDAECLYRGPKKLIIELENNIISNKEFSKANELPNYPTKVLNHSNFNLNDLKAVYRKEGGGGIINIAFDNSNSKMYYSAWYY